MLLKWLLIRKSKKKSCYETLLLSLRFADILAASMFLMCGILIILSTDLVGHLSDVTKGTIQMITDITKVATGISLGLSSTNVGLMTIERYIALNFASKASNLGNKEKNGDHFRINVVPSTSSYITIVFLSSRYRVDKVINNHLWWNKHISLCCPAGYILLHHHPI